MTSNPSKENRVEKFLKYATIISMLPLVVAISTLIAMVIAAFTGHSDFVANAGHIIFNRAANFINYSLISLGLFYFAYTVYVANRLQSEQNNNQPG